MENIYSKGEDVKWLAYEIKNKLGSKVSFNEFGIDNPILTGIYCNNGCRAPYYGKDAVRFYIKFCKGYFLRIQIPEDCNKEENILNAMSGLIDGISTIVVNGSYIGYPLALYETDSCLTSEYSFKEIDKTIKDLKDNTFFDDGDVTNLEFVRTCENCDFGSYGLEFSSGEETLYCKTGGVDLETKPTDVCEDHQEIEGDFGFNKVKVKCSNVLKRNRGKK